MGSKYRLYAFGSNGEGQLGLDYASDKVLAPEEIVTLSEDVLPTIKSFRGGGNHTLLLTYTHGVCKVWITGKNTADSEPKPSGHLHVFQEGRERISLCAAAWDSSTYVVDNTYDPPLLVPSIYTQGRQHHGELGLGATVEQPVFFKELSLNLGSAVAGLAAGMYHYVIVLENGDAYGWGRSSKGQLGITTPPHVTTPIPIIVPFTARRVTCGQNFTFIVGDSATGEHMVLGDDKHGIQSKKPKHIKGWKDIGATWNAVFVLYEDGRLEAWGKSDLWQLVPPNLPKLSQIAVGSDHILALTTGGKLLSWGWAVHGNCGDTRNLAQPLVKGYVTGQWNDLTEQVKGAAVKLGAGYSTSFVLTRELE